MTTEEAPSFSFRWGIPTLDSGFILVYNFMLTSYAKVGLTRDEFLLILHLARYHYDNPNGRAQPSQDTLAEEMGFSHRNSVINLIRSLKTKGMLLTTSHLKGKTLTYDFSPFSRAAWKLYQESLPTTPPAQDGVHGDAQDGVHEEEKRKKKKKEDKSSGTASGKAEPINPEMWSVVSSGLDTNDRRTAASVAKVCRSWQAAGIPPEEAGKLRDALLEVSGEDYRLAPTIHGIDPVVLDLHKNGYMAEHVRALGVFWKRENWPGGRPTINAVRNNIYRVRDKVATKPTHKQAGSKMTAAQEAQHAEFVQAYEQAKAEGREFDHAAWLRSRKEQQT